ncbi:polysaccharide biosynthesis tyrosine autokinase [Acidobacteria bacterium AH-259-L09]|nr:polysaccharide biosynthesis tyrosine autokinase [Acidobacteria bacterium AH-259-L09]
MDKDNPIYPQYRDEIELRDYYRVVVRHKWLILAVVVSVFTLVAIQTFTATPIYRSTVRVRIDPEAADVLPYKNVAEASEMYLATEAYLQTEYKILQSRALVRRVIEIINLADDPIFNEVLGSGFWGQFENSFSSLMTALFSRRKGLGDSDSEGTAAELVDRFLGKLQVQPIRSTRLVEVSFLSHNPRFAAKVVNVLAEEFIEQNFESRYEATTRATDFLQQQLEQLKIKVEKSEEHLISYARGHGILDVDERQNIVLQKLAALSEEVTNVQADLFAKTARHETLKDATPEHFLQSLKNELIGRLENRLFELEQDLASLSVRFGPDWPDVVKVNNEIWEVKEQLLREKERAIEEAEIDYGVALSHYEKLSSALEEQKTLADRLNEDSIQYDILKREAESNKQLYEGLLRRLKEAGVSAGLKSSNIHIVDHGEISRTVYRPRAALNLALGLAIGLVLGVGLAFLTEHLDNTLKTPDQVEEILAIPSLGVVPVMGNLSDRATHLLPAEGTGDTEGASVLPYTLAGSRIWEAYRSLRTSLLLSSSGQQPKTVLITSSFTGEGKTTTVTNVGIVFAQTGARTLLIDLDMRKPMLARLLGIDGGQGMSTFLSANSDLSSQIKQTPVPNLFVLPAGPIPPNPAELIGSKRMQEALTLLGQHFKYIVIDSPPVLSVTDPLVLSPLVDGVVMVIHGGKTPRDAVRKADDHLQDVGAKILGAVINNVNTESSEYYYYYRYYYDYGYYESRGSRG